MPRTKIIALLLLTIHAPSYANASWFGLHQTQGRRPTMEDAHCCDVNSQRAFFAVYDGHGGKLVADFAAQHLHEEIIINPAELNKTANALDRAFVKVHDNLDQIPGKGYTQGSTALAALIKENKLYIANAGDSRAVLSSNGVAHALSTDHKADNPTEKSRIEKLGGMVVTIFNVARVNARLAVARALGDKDLHPYVIPNPEITKHLLTANDEFLILACDGLWDVMDNQTAVTLTKNVLSKQAQPDYNQAAQMLVNTALERGSRDNISVMIIGLQKFR